MTKETQTSAALDMFEGASSTWDDMPVVIGVTELVKSWIVRQPWWNPPLDGPALDFGCGTGCLTMALRDGLGEKVVGIDMSKGMLEQFGKKAEGKGVTTAVIELTGPGQLGPGADGSFALIYTCLVLHHIRDCKSTISTLAGYLRPGGRLLLFDFEATNNAERFHGQELEVGKHLEHHGIGEADLRGWCEETTVLEDIKVERLPFRFEGGAEGAFGTGEEYQMLALSCTKTST